MNDHYCCKRCHRRYDDCTCEPTVPAPTTPRRSMNDLLKQIQEERVAKYAPKLMEDKWRIEERINNAIAKLSPGDDPSHILEIMMYRADLRRAEEAIRRFK